MNLRWYVNDQGKLCVGKSTAETLAKFNIETTFEPGQSFEAPLTEEHVHAIGSYPEDWAHDTFITEKISAAARIIFEDKFA